MNNIKKEKRQIMEETYDREGKLPTFDGDLKNFANWWKRFLAFTTINKFKEILKEIRDAQTYQKKRLAKRVKN